MSLRPRGSRARIAFVVVMVAAIPTTLASAAGEPGAPDTTFGQGGSAVVAFETLGDGSSADTARGLVLEPDGRIVVAGTKVVADTYVSTVLAALRPDGSLDTSFGNEDGRLFPAPGNQQVARAGVAGIERQSSGRLVVAGTYETASGSNRFGVLRFTRRGARDPSFEGSGGRLVDVPGVYEEEVTGMAVQSDDRIVVAGHGCKGTPVSGSGSCQRVFVVVRLTPSGAPDTTFGGSSSGVVTTSFPSADDAEARAVAVQPNGRIVVVGSADVDGSERLALVRHRTNGTLDPTFDDDGRVLTNIASARDEAAHAVAIQPDGKIVVAGVADVGTESVARDRFALARYRADGGLDASFDGDGLAITGSGPWNLTATAVALTPNGRIVAAGEARDRLPRTTGRCSVYRLALVRYLADGRPDPGFDRDGRVLRVGPSSRATDVAVRLDGRIVAVGESERGVNRCGLRTDFLVTRHRG